MKEHYCKICGETNPDRFSGFSKGKCKKCLNLSAKEKYISLPKKIKDYKCILCGDTNPENFNCYIKEKCKCKSCEPLFKSKYSTILKDLDKPKPYHCDCGETNPDAFHISRKFKCKKCLIDLYKKLKCKCKSCGDTDPLNFSERNFSKCDKCTEIYREKHIDTNKIKTKTIDDQRFYICDIHGDVPISESRRARAGCPDCNKNNKIYGKIKTTDGLRFYSCDIHGEVPVASSRRTRYGCPICKEAQIENDKLTKKINREIQIENNKLTKIIDGHSFYKCDIHGNVSIPHNYSINKGCPTCSDPTYTYQDNNLIFTINKKRFYKCNIHGDVPVGKKRTNNMGCPDCNINKRQNELLTITIDNQRYYKCIIHGNVPIGKHRETKDGCPDCNAHNQLLKKALLEKNLLFKIIDNQKYYICSIHGDVPVGKWRSTKEGCPDCNKNIRAIEKLKLDEERLKLKEKTYIITNYVSKDFYSFEEIKDIVVKNNITSFREYKAWRIKINDPKLPHSPNKVYISKFTTYPDFFNIDYNMSHGEKKITDILTNKKVYFIYQKKFDDCRNINPLPFDFYLPDYNLIIEFDGDQHINPTNRFGSEYSLEKTQQHDHIKNGYCKLNNINLLRIPYPELINNTIESTINNKLNELEYQRQYLYYHYITRYYIKF